MKSYIILFDGVCNFCNGFVNFIIQRDKNAVFKFASLQSEFGQSILAKHKLPLKDYNSLVLVDQEEIYLKSSAAIKILSQLGGLFSLFKLARLFPRFLSDKIYDLIAKNRYKILGKSESCRIPSPQERKRFL